MINEVEPEMKSNSEIKSYSAKDEIKYIILEVLNFIEVMIHSILYVKSVYPREMFQSHKMYNINIKFLNDNLVTENINEFLKSLEILLNSNILKSISVLILDAEKNKVLDYFTIEIDMKGLFVKYHIMEFDYDDLVFTFKSIIHRFYSLYSNKKDNHPNINKTIQLCVETNQTNIISDSKEYSRINSMLISDWVEDLNQNESKYKSELISSHDNFNFSISVLENKLYN